MITFHVKDQGKVGVITLEGSIDIQNAEELKSNLITAFQTVDRVDINIERLENMDVSCLELFYSAHLTSRELKKTISFCSSIPGTFRTKLEDAGFIRHIGCMNDGDKNCLWVSCNS